MAKNKFGYEDVINLLIKRAKGFYYTEEQFEYEKMQNKYKSSENNILNHNNLSFFDYDVRGEIQNKNSNDTIKISNGESAKTTNENLTLVKKKVSTHYISPDMLAIKILFEIFREKVDENEIVKMSDNELLKLKKELLEELKNEDFED